MLDCWRIDLSSRAVVCGAGVLGQMQHHSGSPTGLAPSRWAPESERESRTWDGPRGQVLHWVRRRCLKVADSWGSLL